MWHTISRGKVWQGEICNRRKDGSLYWVASTITPFLDSNGQPYQYVSIRTDITSVKQLEQQANTTADRLTRSQIFANISTWDWDMQTNELFWSERIAPLFGLPAEEIETSYESFLTAVHPDDRLLVSEAINTCVESGVEYDIEHRVVWPSGQVRWLHEKGDVVRTVDGKPLHMLGVVMDIHARKTTELALMERESQLREAQTLAHIGNWQADLRCGTLEWSDEIYHIFGHQPGSFQPTIEAFKAAVHPEDRELVLMSEQRAQQSGHHDVVHRIIQPDGTVRHVHELAQAEVDSHGKMVRLMGTVQDVTAQVETEQELIATRDEADRANRAKSEFLSSMSHELRTPMNAILGFAQILEYDPELDQDQLDSVQEILKGGRHLLELINEVLDLAKIESGRIDLSLEPVEIGPIIDACLSLIEPLAQQRHIHLRYSGQAGTMVRADRTRIKQVLLNLLSNAIKYNHRGGNVQLTLEPIETERLRICVTDTGPGIAAADLAALFQPFNRLHAANSDIEGTGIGLTITRRIVELMGGTVEVESELGVGSRFWIDLPMEESTDADRSHTFDDNGEPRTDPKEVNTQHTILYIEDNPANLRLVAQLLGRQPHIQLITAHTPELGIEVALIRQPALILLDINMPGMDGYQVLEVLRSDPLLRETPIVAITANAMPRDIERGMAAGFTDYLTKPLNVTTFHTMIKQQLQIAPPKQPSSRSSIFSSPRYGTVHH